MCVIASTSIGCEGCEGCFAPGIGVSLYGINLHPYVGITFVPLVLTKIVIFATTHTKSIGVILEMVYAYQQISTFIIMYQ